jgi:hypothetical protein
MAGFNKTNALQVAHQLDRAMPALRFAFDYCAESHDPLIKERAAGALFALAGQYAALGRQREWAETLYELVVRCSAAGEPAVQEIIGRALEVYPALLTSLPPPSHTLDSEYNRQGFIGILEESGDQPFM